MPGKIFASPLLAFSKLESTMKTRVYAQAGALAIATAVAVSFSFAAGGGAGGGAAAGAAGGGGRGGRGGAAPEPPPSEGVVLPKSYPADGKPQINGPRITGATPGRPFIFHIPTTGDDVSISVDGLPDGLSVDAKTGMITGSLKSPGVKAVTIHAKNAKGEAARQFVIVGGTHKLALTPPLGWNSWNCYGGSVTQDNMQAAADGMVKSGLANHGFQYVNLDDGWEIRPGGNGRRGGAGGAASAPAAPPTRMPDGTIIVNNKFPNMKALGDYIHAKGLKFGIYSGPGPTTCQGLEATWQHEDQDARTWASWGVDYIKYDWCGYTSVVPEAPAGYTGRTYPINRNGTNIQIAFDELKVPYSKMRSSLDKLDRDLIFSLCQYGWGNVWEWGAQPDISGDLWRCTGDISTNANQVWGSMSGIGFQQNGHEKFASAGHWNDTDMLIVGKIGLAYGGVPRPTGLTENEQLTHIGLWAMLAAPMLLGCDMNSMDEFTTNLMCNDEMLAVDQDPLGKQAWRIAALDAAGEPVGTQPAPTPATASAPAGGRGGRGGRGGNPQNSAAKQIWVRPLWDGTCAVGLFNLDTNAAKISVSLKDINAALKSSYAAGAPVRDVWMLKNLAPATDTITVDVARHGMAFLKIGTPKSEAECIADPVKLHSGQ
jgi:alpha-galactosidase